MPEQKNNPEKSKETREILLQEITQKVQTVITDLRETFKTLTGVQIRNAYESSIKNLNLFVEELSTLSDEEIQTIFQNLKNEIKNEIDKIAQNQNSQNSPNPLNLAVGNVVNTLISERKEKARLAALLLALIRSEFPSNGTNDEPQDFGFPTSSQRIETNGGSSVIEKMKLREDYYLTFKEIITHFYLDTPLNKVRKYTGAEDPNTVRVRPYSQVSIQDKEGQMKVIIADCFVEGNAMFVFNIEKLKSDGTFGITAEMDFFQIAQILNSQLKKELENREGVTRIPHDKGYKGKVIAEIGKILEGKGTKDSNTVDSKVEKISRQENFEILVAKAKIWMEDNQRQPKRNPDDPLELKLYNLIARLKQGKEPLKKTIFLELGFDINTPKANLSFEESKKLFEEWARSNRTETGEIIQPKLNSEIGSLELFLAARIKKLKTELKHPLRSELVRMGFVMDPIYEIKSFEEWKKLFKKWKDSNTTETGEVIQPSQHSKNSSEKELGVKIKSLKNTPNHPLILELVRMGFNMTKRVYSDEKK